MSFDEELKFFGILVLKGRLKKEDVLKCLAKREELKDKGKEVSLSRIAAGLKIISPEKLARYKLSGGEEVPDMPGFELRAKIGEGGMSSVFKYYQKAADRTVAVKILKEELAGNKALSRSFLREAKTLIDLEHENIVKGYRAGTVQGRYVFIMEYVDGESLQELIARKMTFDEDSALYVVLQATKAMEYLLGRNILHRDIKPGNLLIDRKNTVKLIDLGLATTIGTDDELSDDDTTIGTAHYISPEQARGQKDLDVRSDIYSLGATLYQLVLGELPFTGETDQEVMAHQILDSLSSKALKSGRGISPHMHYFIEKMMVKDREIRYQNPAELIKDIEDKIKGKKTLFYRPDMVGKEEEALLSGPYGREDEDEPPPRPKTPTPPRPRGKTPPRLPRRKPGKGRRS
jgi:serine/threonine-protein kinase